MSYGKQGEGDCSTCVEPVIARRTGVALSDTLPTYFPETKRTTCASVELATAPRFDTRLPVIIRWTFDKPQGAVLQPALEAHLLQTRWYTPRPVRR